MIGIHGFYGMGNLGDEALLCAFLQEGKGALGNNFKPLVFSYNPQIIKKNYAIASAPISFSRRKPNKWLSRKWAMLRCSSLVLGGGGLLNDYGKDSTSVRTWLSLIGQAAKKNKKTAFYCIGVDSIRYPESERMIKDILPTIDFVSVRDERSAEILKSLCPQKEIFQVSDPATLLCTPKTRQLAEPPRIAVCLRHWFSDGEYNKNQAVFDNVIRSLAATLDGLIEKYKARITFIPLRDIHYDNDVSISRQTIKAMKNGDAVFEISTPPTVNQFIVNLDDIDILIGMRLHAIILALSCGIPCVGLNYMPKVAAFMKSAGCENYCFEMQPELFEPLSAAIDSIIKDYYNLSGQITASTRNLQKQTHLTIQQMFSVLKV